MKASFDLSFTKFISPSIAKIVYVPIMVVIGLFYLIAVISSFEVSAVLGMVVLVIVGPIVGLLYLGLARVGLESLIATIRSAANTAELVRLNGGGRPFAPAATPGNYPFAPQYPPTPQV